VTRLILIASSDDYLLEEAVAQAVTELTSAQGGVEPQVLGEDTTPEQLALEIQTPSLFAEQRVLVVEQVQHWLSGIKAVQAPKYPGEKPDISPLVEALGDGVPDDLGLVISAWCGESPKGDLADVVKKEGEVRWVPLPPPPKPWEDVLISDAEREVLDGVLNRALGDSRIEGRAKNLLLERLGFAPRLLAQETKKLATAAGADRVIDEQLVRSLSFPAERSLERVRDSVLKRRIEPLLDLLTAAQQGTPVRDWRGQRLDPAGLVKILIGQVGGLFEQMLYLRCIAAEEGLSGELAPSTTSRKGWYARHFKTKLAPQLLERLRADNDAPLNRAGKAPSPWTLGELFAGAGRYSDADLVNAVIELGGVERDSRGSLALAAMSRWLTECVAR
jgi:hypothetical protein